MVFSKKVKNKIKNLFKELCALCGCHPESFQYCHIISNSDKNKGPRHYTKNDRYKHLNKDQIVNIIDHEDNGLFLCSNCHKTIDIYVNKYSIQFLEYLRWIKINNYDDYIINRNKLIYIVSKINDLYKEGKDFNSYIENICNCNIIYEDWIKYLNKCIDSIYNSNNVCVIDCTILIKQLAIRKKYFYNILFEEENIINILIDKLSMKSYELLYYYIEQVKYQHTISIEIILGYLNNYDEIYSFCTEIQKERIIEMFKYPFKKIGWYDDNKYDSKDKVDLAISDLIIKNK